MADLKLIPLSLRDLSSASCAFAKCQLPSHEFGQCLIVAFEGEAGNSRECVGTFYYMLGMIAARIEAWSPQAVVLDLRKLKYEWGDQMAQVLGGRPLPTTVVISALNREGLTSLVDQELFTKPSDWLFDSIEAAVAGCDRKYTAVLADSGSDRPAT